MNSSVDDSFSLYQKLNHAFSAPVSETYGKTLHRRLKNFTSNDVRASS